MKEEIPLVCDTSVVSNFGRRGDLRGLVERLRQEGPLIVPQEVESELLWDDQEYYRSFLEKHFEVIRTSPKKLEEVAAAAGSIALDAGESSVLALCLERNWRPCIDETQGRAVARRLKLHPVGTIGLLQRAAALSWMSAEECLEAVRSLRTAGFYCPKVLANDDFSDYVARLKK